MDMDIEEFEKWQIEFQDMKRDYGLLEGAENKLKHRDSRRGQGVSS